MQSPASSVFFEVNGFSIHYYGVIMFFAIVIGLLVIRFIAKKYYKDIIDTDIVLDILPAIIIFSIIGARLYYVLMDFDYYSNHMRDIIAVWNGGMSIHGAIIGGVVTGFVLSKVKKFSFFKYADLFSYGLAVGQAIGRFGNYFNCEAFGRPSSIPFLKLYIPMEHRPFGYEEYSYFHPTFLYESMWDLLVFLILFFVVRKIVVFKKLSDGTIFFSYLVLYSLGRYFIEWCRLDNVRDVLGIPIAELVSILLIFIGLFSLIWVNKKNGKI